MNRTSILLAAAATLTIATSAFAVSTPIAGPGGYGVGSTTSAMEPDLAGVVLADRLQAFTINGATGGVATGTIQERVVRSNATGFLDFYHAVTLDTAAGFSPGSYVEWLEFDPAATGDPFAVGRRTDGLGSPTSSNYDLAANGMSRYDFNLIGLDPANAGFVTQFHFLRTEATNFALTGQLQLSGFEFVGASAQGLETPWLPTWAPTSAVPEPATWAMLTAGLGLLGLAIRQQRPTVARSKGAAS